MQQRIFRARGWPLLLVVVGLFSWWSPPAGGLPAGYSQPLPIEGVAPPTPPDVSAATWILWDDTYERELASQGADERRPMASTTKMMTAVVALEQADVDELIVISHSAAAVGEAEIGLVAGESIPLRDLLYPLLMQSANDAAVAVAEGVGGDVETFVAMMNAKAADLSLENTAFVNPHGLDAPGHYSSARDLLTLARYGMEIEVFAEIVGTRTYDLAPFPDGTPRTARSINELIRTYDGAFGVKTGFTDGAGLTLVAGAERDERRLYSVVIGSDDHFLDTAALLNYGFLEFQLLALIDPSEIDFTIRTPAGTVPAVASEEVDAFISSTEQETVTVTPSFDDGVPTATALVSGEEVGHTALTAEASGDLPGLVDSVAWASRYWDWLWGRSG